MSKYMYIFFLLVWEGPKSDEWGPARLMTTSKSHKAESYGNDALEGTPVAVIMKTSLTSKKKK